jgi:uncharacterized protein YbjT (DUF2867 family)
MSKRSVLIIGGNGLIGKQLQKDLTYIGFKFDILSRNPVNQSHIKGDITNKDSIKTIVKNYKYVVNLVGLSPLKPLKYYKLYKKVHIDGVKNILTSLSPDSIFIHISANIPIFARWMKYSRTKIEAEKLIYASETSSVIIRPKFILSKESEILKNIKNKSIKSVLYRLFSLIPHNTPKDISEQVISHLVNQ